MTHDTSTPSLSILAQHLLKLRVIAYGVKIGAVVDGGEIRKPGFKCFLHGLKRLRAIASCSVCRAQPVVVDSGWLETRHHGAQRLVVLTLRQVHLTDTKVCAVCERSDLPHLLECCERLVIAFLQQQGAS